MLIHIDSGSTHTFVDQALSDRVSVPAQKMQRPMQVKVANGGLVDFTKFVPELTWWIKGHNFSSAMQVLPLGGYDIILGMDWLEQWSVMKCHWAAKWIQFQYKGQDVRLQWVLPVKQDHIEEVSAE